MQHNNQNLDRDAGSNTPERLLKIKEIAEIVGIDQRTLYRRIASGAFPPADLRSGVRIVRWRISTVRAWIDAGGGRHPIPVETSRLHPSTNSRAQSRRVA